MSWTICSELGRAVDEGPVTGEGWTRQFTVEAWRVGEYVELYRSLGLETRVEPATPAELGEECAACYLAQCESFRTIYTRPATPDANSRMVG